MNVLCERWPIDDINLWTEERPVDPFSLYLSLRDIKDERIEYAMEEMMEGIEW